jgi:peptidoglycan hydrolase-like protein with peptidoglycan-binding domain
MPRLPLFLLAALVATPVLALEEGSYPVQGDAAQGEISVTERWLSLTLIGENACQAVGEGRVLRGADGAWTAVFETGAEPCVLVGDENGFVPVGASCGAFGSGACELRGQLGAGDATQVADADPAPRVTASEPVQVITSVLRGRFNAMSASERRAVQALLAERGFYGGGIDGAYGPGTEAGLIAELQFLADEGQEVDGNSTRFVRELLEDMAEEGAELIAQAAPTPRAEPDAGLIYARAWSCGGYTFRFTPDSYRMINEYDGSVLNEGVLRPDLDGRTAYMELVGYGNLTFAGVGTRDMVMHDPTNAETWDCVAL